MIPTIPASAPQAAPRSPAHRDERDPASADAKPFSLGDERTAQDRSAEDAPGTAGDIPAAGPPDAARGARPGRESAAATEPDGDGLARTGTGQARSMDMPVATGSAAGAATPDTDPAQARGTLPPPADEIPPRGAQTQGAPGTAQGNPPDNAMARTVDPGEATPARQAATGAGTGLAGAPLQNAASQASGRARPPDEKRLPRDPAPDSAIRSAAADRTGAPQTTAATAGTAAIDTAAAPIPSGELRDPSADMITAARDMDLTRTDTGRADPARADAPRADLARSVGGQLVEAVRAGPNGTTDVALNPEELGRVRLSLTAQDGVLHVTVLAERPETHELLRRHINLLGADFRALGYSDVAFDFGSGGEQAAGDAPPPAQAAPTDPDTDADIPPTGQIAAIAGGPHRGSGASRLDLRF